MGSIVKASCIILKCMYDSYSLLVCIETLIFLVTKRALCLCYSNYMIRIYNIKNVRMPFYICFSCIICILLYEDI